jgi:glycosyltransferase involved in cell wall biosynthesis
MKEREKMIEKRTIIFSHRRAVGDALMFTCGVRDFKLLFPDIDIIVNSNFPEVWLDNPYITELINIGADKVNPNEGVEYYKVGYPIINNANAASTHYTQGFLLDMIAMADNYKPLPISLSEFCAAFSNGRMGDPDIDNPKTAKYKSQKDGGLQFLPDKLKKLYADNDSFCQNFGRIRPDIYLNGEEKQNNIIRKHYGIERYWVVAPGGKRDCTCKIWDWRRFQKVIDHFDGYIKFVVIGRSDHLVEKLNNVIDLTDKYNNDLRGLFPVVYHADGCVSGVSLLLHLCAAMPNRNNERIFPKPCVTIYGGREPLTFTAYNQTHPLHTGGAIDCCVYGGCWHSRIVPLQKDVDKNKRLCKSTVERDGKVIQRCMDMITSDDVIRQIERLYEGDILKPINPVTKPIQRKVIKLRLLPKLEEKDLLQTVQGSKREINVLASMNTDGGGEQSAAHIVKMLRDAGWKVNFHPWSQEVHSRYNDVEMERDKNFCIRKDNIYYIGPMVDTMKKDLPLLFYANDNVNNLIDIGKGVIDNSSDLIVGINFINGKLPKAPDWLSDKLRAVIFQNEEKMMEYERDQLGQANVEKIVLFGAIDLNRFIDILPASRKDGDRMVVLKHCKPDYRKYITSESAGGGERIHVWQKHFSKDRDVDFYKRLLKDTTKVYFEFMEAHKELVAAFPNEERMKFFKWDEIPVEEFLARGHVYLYRTSNMWRDQYPRVVAEALAAGLPVLTEPRDGTKDRVIHGDTGFYCIDYDQFKLAIATFKRKEQARRSMGMYAKDWARQNLNPKRWVEILDSILENENIRKSCDVPEEEEETAIQTK